MTKQKPRWSALAIIGLIFLLILIEETILPLSPAAETWALLLLVIVFYGTLLIWVNRNSAALEQEPQTLDCAGQPIFDFNAIEPREDDTAESMVSGLPAGPSLSRSIGRSEAY